MLSFLLFWDTTRLWKGVVCQLVVLSKILGAGVSRGAELQLTVKQYQKVWQDFFVLARSFSAGVSWRNQQAPWLLKEIS